MAAFTTRVELHNATYADYAALHSAMERRKFNRLIRSDDGRAFHLPTAEYVSQGDIAISDVLGLARAAAQETGRTSSIIVTEAVRWQWDNLTPAT